MAYALHACPRVLALTLAVAAVFAAATPVRADLITQIATETMMEDEAANNVLLAHIFGTSGTSTLHYTSYVDPAGMSFSYALVPNSTYLGQPITMSAGGTFDPATSSWSVSSTGVIGDPPFSTAGKQQVQRNPDGSVDVTSDVDHMINGGKDGDIHYHLSLTIDQDGNVFSVDTGFLTNAKGVGQLGTDFNSLDVYDAQDDIWVTKVRFVKYDEIAGTNFNVDSSGMSPAGGGFGTFTTLIATVPEPSVPVLVLVGALATLSGLLRRRRAG